MNINIKDDRRTGFTLIELLIVISIVAILAVALIFVLNPAETLKKSRDAQRISDLSTLKSAIGIYKTSTTTPQLAGTSNTACKTGVAGGSYAAGSKIYYSLATTTPITDATLDGGAAGVPAPWQVLSVSSTLTDGTGWLPINLDSLIGGSSVASLPVDPVNTIASLSAVSGVAIGATPPDYVYRYACNGTSLTYEIDAILESDSYTTGTDNKMIKDGGNNAAYYEFGTNLKILGMGTDF